MRSESTRALGQPRLTKPTRGGLGVAVWLMRWRRLGGVVRLGAGVRNAVGGARRRLYRRARIDRARPPCPHPEPAMPRRRPQAPEAHAMHPQLAADSH